MVVQSQTLVEAVNPTKPAPRLDLVGGNMENWMEELRTVGWTVIPNTISEERAAEYVDHAYTWLESWGFGFDRNDPSTHTTAQLPFHIRGGLYNRLSIAHQQWVWDLKSEPSLVEKFEQIWGTKELLVSYDGLNMSIPDKTREASDPALKPWPHVDQSPYRHNLQCVQGILNLLPNGPEDGGLMVLQGSNALYTELWQHFDHKKPAEGWNKWEMQPLDDEMVDWLISKGCKWVKVCPNPGDLMLWDSPVSVVIVIIIIIIILFFFIILIFIIKCFWNAVDAALTPPQTHVSEEARQQRKEAWESKSNTAHDPAVIRIMPRLPPPEHPQYEKVKARPVPEPKLSARARQLAGLDEY
ncbi:hypothetical protein JCM24511_03991 [Saitozyma sp. JCM 24511]|nr:hypothetical protein JCM24511_03991 [Saitozyma sp. JCM 24511]